MLDEMRWDVGIKPTAAVQSIARHAVLTAQSRLPFSGEDKLLGGNTLPDQPYFAVLDDLPKEELQGGSFKRTAIVTDAALIQTVWVAPHHPPAPIDQHPFDQTVVVLSGTLELVLNGEDRYVLTPGCCLYIPADVPHQATVLGDEPLRALDIFAPIREDYLHLAAHQLATGNPASA
ncbi:cupin domain-containing protein [Mycolicibacterium sp. CBM1]